MLRVRAWRLGRARRWALLPEAVRRARRRVSVRALCECDLRGPCYLLCGRSVSMLVFSPHPISELSGGGECPPAIIRERNMVLHALRAD